MKTEHTEVATVSNPAQRIIALGIVFAFLYFAADIVIALLLSILLAYFLDPIVGYLERAYIPRAMGAFLVLLAVTGTIGGLGYMVVSRADQFVAGWPRYSAILRNVSTAFDRKLSTVEKQVDAISPEPEAGPIRVAEPPPIRDWLFRGVGSLYSFLLVATFVPFLVFFMLAAKRQVWKTIMESFPGIHQAHVLESLDQVSSMLRSFLAGNALVMFILMLSSWAFFALVHLDYPFLAGSASGALNMIPYVGVVLAWIPPFLIGIAEWRTVGPYLGVAAGITLLHIIGMNVLMPAIVGRRVRLNALAVTVSLLFWGWLWGAIGLVLAIPITATIKVVSDHTEGWKSVGRWLGS